MVFVSFLGECYQMVFNCINKDDSSLFPNFAIDIELHHSISQCDE